MKAILLACTFALTLTPHVAGQSVTCSGSFGRNVFDNGDFGRGQATILPGNPGYAPGFTYSTSVPFDDGYYTVTNDMGAWPNNYSTWLGIQDNSSDPQGYMMVVNASYTPGIFYEQFVEDLCAGGVYEVSFDVINVVRREVTNHSLPDVSLLLDDSTLLTTGPIPQDETWHRYTLILTSTGDTLKVTLRNNAPGGIGNDLAIDNISFRPCGPDARIINDMPGKICENAIFPTLHVDIDEDVPGSGVQWQISFDTGITWEDIPGATGRSHTVQQLSAGIYRFRYLWAASAENIGKPLCRVRSRWTMVEVVPIEFLIIDTLCEGLSFDLGGTLYDTSGIYTGQYVSSIGCDSIVTLDLTIKPDPGMEVTPGTRPPRCTNFGDAAIWVEEINRGDGPFTLLVSGLPGVTAIDTVEVFAGDYAIVVEDRHGCTAETSVSIDDALPFVITGLRDTEVVVGHQIALLPQFSYPPGSVLWKGQNIACPECVATMALPVQSGEYSVMAYSANGCEANAAFQVTVDEAFGLYIPNVFSPNDDGVNDDWGIAFDGASVAGIEQVTILDRWGGVIFFQQHPPLENAVKLWDGTRNSTRAPAGVYTYALIVNVINGERLYKTGSVTLVR